MVGTGRCGSTLLSRMLAACPSVLGLFEFFTGLDMARRFSAERVSGPEIAQLIASEQPVVTAVLRRGYPVEEITYPLDRDGGARHGRGDALPWILVSTLPRLSDDPDRLFDRVIEFVSNGPTVPAREHYLRLFAWLGDAQGRPDWIERSGSSIDYAAGLLATFPEARLVHIHRDGPEVALSMREHHAYRLPISLLYDAPLDGGARVSALPPIDFDAEPDEGDTISRILRARPPAEFFGRYWSDQIVRGMEALDALPGDRLLTIRFEDLVRDPKPALGRIGHFFGLEVSGGWLDAAAAMVRGIPPTRIDLLADEEREGLLEACRPGQLRLAEAEARERPRHDFG